MQQQKDKMRVYALAKSLDVESKVLLDLCKELGYDVKNQLSGLTAEQCEELKKRLKSGPKTPEPPAARPVVSPTANLSNRVPTLKPVRRESPAPTAPVAETPAKTPEVEAPKVAEAPKAAPAPKPTPVEAAPAAVPPPVKPTPVSPVVEKPTPVEPKPAPVAEKAAVPVVETPAPSPPVVSEPVVSPPVVTPAAPPAVEKPAPVEPQPVPTPAATLPPATVPPIAPRPQPAAPPQMRDLSSRPRTLDTRPARPAGPGTPPRGDEQRPGSTPTPAGPSPTGQRPAPPSGGTSGARPTTSTSHNPSPRNRLHGGQRPGGPGARPGEKKPDAPPVQQKAKAIGNLTPEQMAALREGKAINLTDRGPRPGPGAGGPATAPRPGPAGADRGPRPVRPGAEPTARLGPDAPPAGGSQEDDRRRSSSGGPRHGTGGPGGQISDREKRQQERAKRASQQRPATTTNVVVAGGHVEVIESTRHVKRRHPKHKEKGHGTLPRKEGKVPVTVPITVRSLSEAAGKRVPEVLLRLRGLGITNATINSGLDRDTAELLAADWGVELDIRQQATAEDELNAAVRRAEEEAEADPSKLSPRPPVVTIMGHVDHGKTSILDRIRSKAGLSSDVVSTEAGGITQVIRAWRVEHNGKWITFLDTPGHEAFTKMRARGAQVTDIAVIVVAADDGVMPQTEEAINHAKAAGVKIVVAINKIDLPNANVKKAEQQLYGMSLLPDNMGGDTPFVYTSAKTGIGIDDLLESLSLVAELTLELKANPHRPAVGTCLEAHMSGEEGVFATLLVQQGTLRKGEIVLCGSSYGRVRAMYDDLGRQVTEAGPSAPVKITGLDAVPNADDPFMVVAELAKAREIAESRAGRQKEESMTVRGPVRIESLGEAKIGELKVILKADFRGSLEAIRKELEKLTHDEVRVRVLHTGIGAITESDVQLALTSPTDTIIVGFNAVPDNAALKMAEERGIPIREHNIIYKLTEEIKSALEGKLKPVEEVVHLGRAIVRQTFKLGKVGTIAGCYVTQGTIERSSKVRVIRGGVVVYPTGDKVASLESLKRFKDDVREVREGFECGLRIVNYDDIKTDDVIEAYRIDVIQRTL